MISFLFFGQIVLKLNPITKQNIKFNWNFVKESWKKTNTDISLERKSNLNSHLQKADSLTTAPL